MNLSSSVFHLSNCVEPLFLRVKWKRCSRTPLLHTSSFSCFTIRTPFVAKSISIYQSSLHCRYQTSLPNVSWTYAFAQTFAEVVTIVRPFSITSMWSGQRPVVQQAPAMVPQGLISKPARLYVHSYLRPCSIQV